MEQQLYFVLGMLSVIFLLMIVGMFRINAQLSKNSEKIKSIEETIVDIYNVIGRNSELDNRRIDGEIDRTNRMINDIYRVIDSRFDRFENKLKEKTPLND